MVLYLCICANFLALNLVLQRMCAIQGSIRAKRVLMGWYRYYILARVLQASSLLSRYERTVYRFV